MIFKDRLIISSAEADKNLITTSKNLDQAFRAGIPLICCSECDGGLYVRTVFVLRGNTFYAYASREENNLKPFFISEISEDQVANFGVDLLRVDPIVIADYDHYFFNNLIYKES